MIHPHPGSEHLGPCANCRIKMLEIAELKDELHDLRVAERVLEGMVAYWRPLAEGRRADA